MAPAHLLSWLIGGLCALACALGPGIAAASATDGGSPAPVTPVAATVTPTTAPAPLSPADSTAAAVSQQTAAAVAQAVQQAPVNISIPVRVLSPGDDGPVTQENVAAADAQAVNVTQAQQDQPPAQDAPAAQTAQPATAQQSAGAVAQSTQIAPANIYIPVSILSPGDHGPVTQVNVSGAQAIATNVAQTAGQAVGGAVGQTAGAGSGAAQQSPSNVAAPVTVGGVGVGDHSRRSPGSGRGPGTRLLVGRSAPDRPARPGHRADHRGRLAVGLDLDVRAPGRRRRARGTRRLGHVPGKPGRHGRAVPAARRRRRREQRAGRLAERDRRGIGAPPRRRPERAAPAPGNAARGTGGVPPGTPRPSPPGSCRSRAVVSPVPA